MAKRLTVRFDGTNNIAVHRHMETPPGGASYPLLLIFILALVSSAGRAQASTRSALAHEIEHVELGNISSRVSELAKKKDIQNLRVNDFFPGYGKKKD